METKDMTADNGPVANRQVNLMDATKEDAKVTALADQLVAAAPANTKNTATNSTKRDATTHEATNFLSLPPAKPPDRPPPNPPDVATNMTAVKKEAMMDTIAPSNTYHTTTVMTHKMNNAANVLDAANAAPAAKTEIAAPSDVKSDARQVMTTVSMTDAAPANDYEDGVIR